MAREQYLKYEQEAFGLKFIRFPAPNATKLVVSFPGRGEIYSRLSHFWNNEQWGDTEYVFFNELGRASWYLQYQSLVESVVERFTPANITFIGLSMGVFGALHYGLKFNVGTLLLTSPQVPPMAFCHSCIYPDHERLWPQVLDQLRSACVLPRLYLESTGHAYDTHITKDIVEVYLQRGGKLAVAVDLDIHEHRATYLVDRNFTATVMQFLGTWC